MADLKTLTVDVLKCPQITLDELRSYAGKANHVCNLMYAWRPFISELWAAIHCDASVRSGEVWLKQIVTTMLWMEVFLNGRRGSLVRSWQFDEYIHPRSPGTRYLDASPWGLGGILIIDSRVYGFFGVRLTKHDERIRSAKIYSGESQQIFEALAILVAMKLWLHVLKAKRVVLTLTGDNTSALAMAAKLKITASPIIAR